MVSMSKAHGLLEGLWMRLPVSYPPPCSTPHNWNRAAITLQSAVTLPQSHCTKGEARVCDDACYNRVNVRSLGVWWERERVWRRIEGHLRDPFDVDKRRASTESLFGRWRDRTFCFHRLTKSSVCDGKGLQQRVWTQNKWCWKGVKWTIGLLMH